jgi:uncharacterized OB-fold protein
VYTFTVVHSPGYEGRPAMQPDAYPYVIGVVTIDGGGGARICGNLVGAALESWSVGARVRASFAPGEPVLPVFEPDTGA